MTWLYVFLAGGCEIAWAVGLKLVQKPGNRWMWGPNVVAMILTYVLLYLALRRLEVGVTYAVWTGIGAAGTATLGILCLGESATTLKVLCIALIVAGIIGLKISAGGSSPSGS